MNDREALQQIANIANAQLGAPVEPPVQPPVTPPVTPPVSPPPTGIPPGAHFDFDLGDGGGAYLPSDGRVFEANQLVTFAFTVKEGGNPNLDVFPGTGGWIAREITDYFPYVSSAETRGLPIGTQPDGRGSEHAAGVAGPCYVPGRWLYAVSLNKRQSWHVQYRP